MIPNERGGIFTTNKFMRVYKRKGRALAFQASDPGSSILHTRSTMYERYALMVGPVAVTHWEACS